MDQPGLARQSQHRTVFRVLAILFPIGLVSLGHGFYTFATTEPSFSDTGLPPGFGYLLLGMVLMVVGWLCVGAGFLGAATRYGAGETIPVLKDSAAYLTDGEGVLGVGRTVDDRPRADAATGPFCRRCGTRNDETARFCDSCGQSLA